MTSKLTREELINIIETDHVQCGEASALARIALAAMDSEPVELPLDYLQGHKDGLEWAAQLAEANHPETGDWLYDDPIELAKAIRKGPDMPPAQPAPVVDPDDNFYSWFGREWHENYQHNQYTTAAKQMLGVMAESAWKAGRRAAMLQAEPVTTANKLGNSPVIPDCSAAILRRWLAFGCGMKNIGIQLPRNLLAETEVMLAATMQEVNRG